MSFAGHSVSSKIIENQRNPEFNQTLELAFTNPTMNRTVKIEIWNDNQVQDDLVGTYYINLDDDIYSNNFNTKYINFYGPSPFN